MNGRKGEKIGWIGGWLGGFIWVLILSVVFLVQGKPVNAGIGLLIVCAACATVVLCAPWRYPTTRYRTLMLPVYGLLLVAFVWSVWSFGNPRQMGINNGWSVFVLLPVLMPLWTVGNRRWDDGAP